MNMQSTPSPKAQLRVLQVIHLALMGGIILFFSIVLLLHLSSGPGYTSGDQRSGLDPLMMVNFMMFIGVMVARMVVPPLALKNAIKRLPRGLDEQEFQTAAFPAIQASHIVNLALLEGPALFSVVILLINSNAMKTSPILWINGIPALISIIIMLMLFPTADRYAMKIKEEHALYSLGR